MNAGAGRGTRRVASNSFPPPEPTICRTRVATRQSESEPAPRFEPARVRRACHPYAIARYRPAFGVAKGRSELECGHAAFLKPLPHAADGKHGEGTWARETSSGNPRSRGQSPEDREDRDSRSPRHFWHQGPVPVRALFPGKGEGGGDDGGAVDARTFCILRGRRGGRGRWCARLAIGARGARREGLRGRGGVSISGSERHALAERRRIRAQAGVGARSGRTRGQVLGSVADVRSALSAPGRGRPLPTFGRGLAASRPPLAIVALSRGLGSVDQVALSSAAPAWVRL